MILCTDMTIPFPDLGNKNTTEQQKALIYRSVIILISFSKFRNKNWAHANLTWVKVAINSNMIWYMLILV